MARDTKTARTKKKERKNIAAGVAHVNSSFNNTKILISDVQGNAISWSSSGTMGFKGSRKSTPYAAQMAAEDAGRKAQEHGVKTLEASGLSNIETGTAMATISRSRRIRACSSTATTCASSRWSATSAPASTGGGTGLSEQPTAAVAMNGSNSPSRMRCAMVSPQIRCVLKLG